MIKRITIMGGALLVLSILVIINVQCERCPGRELGPARAGHRGRSGRPAAGHVPSELLDTVVGLQVQLRKCIPALVQGALLAEDEALRNDCIVAINVIGIDAAIDYGPVLKVVASALESGDDEPKLRAVLMLESLGREAEPLVPKLIILLRKGGKLAFLYARALGEIGVRRGVVAELSQVYRKAPVPSALRAEAGLSLARLGVKEVLPRLLEDLEHKDTSASARSYAAEAIGLLGPLREGTAKALLRAARDESEEVREHAVRALGACSRAFPGVAQVLSGALTSRRAGLRKAALGAIVALGVTEDAVVDKIMDIAVEAEDYFERRRAEEALLELPERVNDRLRTVLKTGDARVQAVAARALARTSSKGVMMLVEVIEEQNPHSSKWAAVVELRNAEAYPDLASRGISKAIAMEGFTCFALMTAEAMELRSEGVIGATIGALQNRNGTSEVRALAARVLGIIGRGSQAAEQALRRAGEDPDSSVVSAAKKALKEHGTVVPDKPK